MEHWSAFEMEGAKEIGNLHRKKTNWFCLLLLNM